MSTVGVAYAADDPPSAAAGTPALPPVVVAFGDSVPYASHCGCPGFVGEYATLAGNNAGFAATVHNFSDPGSLSGDVVSELGHHRIQKAVRAATTVLIMTGANDFTAPFSEVRDGASESDVYPPAADRVQANVTAAVQLVQQLNPHAHIVVLDYWAAMKDGAVARREYSPDAQEAAQDATDAVNQALADAVEATHVTYVSTLVAFKGPDGTQDPTDLLAPDGDHPDAAGHAVIAQTLVEALPQG
ncbi:MAG TPA: SGNH/GDSL hydrolase family protein [Sporichthyaceae bacterium]|nr:SGNH/GDSL hydrolase family protein [Sporichthyaceae bacterium]